MLQSMSSQRVGHDIVTGQQEKDMKEIIILYDSELLRSKSQVHSA